MTARRLPRTRPALIAAALVAGLAVIGSGIAQIERGDRGVAPVDSTSNYEVMGIRVDAGGRNADAARMAGWREAQRRGWKQLWTRTHNGAAGPTLPDSTLDSIVAGILVEEEQIGVHRYVAVLGVQFDRARTGRLLGVAGNFTRSAPMLVIPVMWSGGLAQTFESRTEWQKAWARFRAGQSAVDYVRPVGTGVDPLLLNVAQSRRPGRRWWRMLIDLYGASDVVVPEVSLKRQWPGGPVVADFTARHGPDATLLGAFTLVAPSIRALPATLDQGVRRIDAIYTAALNEGRLSPDPSLAIRETAPPDIVASEAESGEGDPLAEIVAGVTAQTYTVQVDTPDAASVGAAEAAIRAVPGVSQAGVTSLAVGGVSLVRVTFAGDQAALAAALGARGLRLEAAGGVLRLRRAPAAPAPAPATAPPPPAAAPAAEPATPPPPR